MVLLTPVKDSITASKIDVLLVQFALSRIKIDFKGKIIPLWPQNKVNGKSGKSLSEAISTYQNTRVPKLKPTGTIPLNSETMRLLVKEAGLKTAGRTKVGYTTVANIAKIIANANIEAEKVFLRAFMPNSDAEALMTIIREAAKCGIEIFVDLKKEFSVDRNSGKISLFLGQRTEKYPTLGSKLAYDFDEANKAIADIVKKSKVWEIRKGKAQNLSLRKGYNFLKIGRFKAAQTGIDFFGGDSPMRRAFEFVTGNKSKYASDWRIKLIIDAAYKLISDEAPISGEAADIGNRGDTISPTRKARLLKMGEMLAQVDKQLSKGLFSAVFSGNRSGLKFRQIYPLHAANLDIAIQVYKALFAVLSIQFIMDPNDRKEYLLIKPKFGAGKTDNTFSAGLSKLDKSIVDFSTFNVEPFLDVKSSFVFGPIELVVALKNQKMTDRKVTLNGNSEVSTSKKKSSKKRKNKAKIETIKFDFGAVEFVVNVTTNIDLDADIDVKLGAEFPTFLELDTDVFDDVFYRNSVPLDPNLRRF